MSRRPRITPAFAVSVLALFVALSTTSYAASGEAFILGQANSATSKSSLSAKLGSSTLAVSNTSTKPTATALDLSVKPGHPPLTVNSSTTVPGLSADLLDGLDSAAFLRSLAPQHVIGSDPTSAFSATNTGNGNGVQGITSGAASGVYGENDGGGFGVAGRSNADGGIGVLGESTSDSGLAGKFIGNVQIQGGLVCSGCIPDGALLNPAAHASDIRFHNGTVGALGTDSVDIAGVTFFAFCPADPQAFGIQIYINNHTPVVLDAFVDDGGANPYYNQVPTSGQQPQYGTFPTGDSLTFQIHGDGVGLVVAHVAAVSRGNTCYWQVETQLYA